MFGLASIMAGLSTAAKFGKAVLPWAKGVGKAVQVGVPILRSMKEYQDAANVGQMDKARSGLLKEVIAQTLDLGEDGDEEAEDALRSGNIAKAQMRLSAIKNAKNIGKNVNFSSIAKNPLMMSIMKNQMGGQTYTSPSQVVNTLGGGTVGNLLKRAGSGIGSAGATVGRAIGTGAVKIGGQVVRRGAKLVGMFKDLLKHKMES